MKKLLLPCAAAIIMGLVSCSEPAGWSVGGAVDGAPAGTRIALERYNNGLWMTVDSLTVENDGTFRYDAEAPAHYIEIMRISYPDKGYIFFPVDSVDKIQIESDTLNFAGNARVSGSDLAGRFRAVDSIISSAVARLGNAAATDEDMRRNLVSMITADTTGIVGYYVVSKTIGNRLIFNPADNFGNRVFGAAAQVFAQYRPDDPRGEALLHVYLEGRRAMGRLTGAEGSQTVVEVPSTGLIDIERYDNDGNRHSLAELADSTDVVVLSFTSYDNRQSPAYNALLNEIYVRYHDRGLQIYQLAFDENEVDWKTTAVNLPWITVWNSPVDGLAAAASYNVNDLPLTYIIARGDIGERVEDPSALAAAVARYYR